jgi:DedD protein
MFSKNQTDANSSDDEPAESADVTVAQFKKRKLGKARTDDELLPEKKRARRRLIGALTIVLVMVIGLPMILDSEPKPVNKNIAIQIPAVQEDDSSSDSIDSATDDVQDEASAIKESSNAPAASAPKQPEQASTPVASAQPPAKPSTGKQNDDAARALAILNDSADSSKASNKSQRIVVQVGAFSSQEKVTELRKKLKSAGIDSYTQQVGDKIRVRIGPFTDKAQAEEKKTQLQKLGISAKLITL